MKPFLEQVPNHVHAFSSIKDNVYFLETTDF